MVLSPGVPPLAWRSAAQAWGADRGSLESPTCPKETSRVKWIDMTFWFEMLWHPDLPCYDINGYVPMGFALFVCICPMGFACFICLCLRPPRSSTFFFHDPLIFSTTLHGFWIIIYICPMVFAWVMVTPSTIPCGPRIPNIESIQGPFFNMCN